MKIYFLLFLIGFLLVHFCKMMRLYLVLMEHGISFGRFVVMYLETTLVNLIIPFKIGEAFRILVISKETNHWQVGILSVLTDRFFDTLALCAILLPVDLYLYGEPGIITIVFLLVLLLIAICYLSVLPTYRYLNRYIIMRKHSSRSMAALSALDTIKEWFDFTTDLIKGRFALITMFSFFGWVFEIGTLTALARYFNIAFSTGDFIKYIQAIFAFGSSDILKEYTSTSILLMGIFTFIGVIAILRAKPERKKA